jgi:type I restriction-modification system DNA methylase subunit
LAINSFIIFCCCNIITINNDSAEKYSSLEPRNLVLEGQEGNYGTVGMCKMNMVLHGAAGNNVYISWWERNQTSNEPVLRVSNDNGKPFGEKIMLSVK